VLRPGTGRRQGGAQVVQDLLGLCGDVSDADDVPLGVDRVLAADVDRPHAARDHRNVAERRVAGQAIGVEELHATVHGRRGSRHDESFSFLRRRWAATFARLPQRSMEHQRIWSMFRDSRSSTSLHLAPQRITVSSGVVREIGGGSLVGERKISSV
jgi:hypothetical protein